MRLRRAILIGVLAILCVPCFGQGVRDNVSLNGEWQLLRAPSLDTPAEGEWTPVSVPSTLSSVAGEAAWFRTTFQVPAAWQGGVVQLYFGGVKYNSRVLVNGQAVGGCFNGHDPFTLDITDAVRVGEANALLLGCYDWQGIFTEPLDLADAQAGGDDTRSMPQDVILGPIGGLYDQFGPWDDVELQVRPAIHVERLGITTSVRERTLTLDYAVTNASLENVQVDVVSAVDADEPGLPMLAGVALTVPAGETATAQVTAEWAEPRLWSHEDPHLYYLDTTILRDGATVDTLRTRLGFREFWCEGQDFYLNGSKIHMLASSGWPMHNLATREEVREFLVALREGNNVAFRTHTQPWRSWFYDVADEIGLLMIPEGAIWNDDGAYRVNDPAFWQNYADHLNSMVEHYRNHPSVVMYSLENEFYGGRMNERNTFATEELANLGRLMKQWDPMRPIVYESDGDPLGVADVIGLHYPHEYPDFNLYPETAWWQDEGTPWSDIYGKDEDGRWRWKRNKPLYIGEFLWVPSSTPAWDAVLMGDMAYTDYMAYHRLAKALAWKMQIEGYRDEEVSGICPWTEVEGGPLDDENPMYVAQREAFRPIAAFPKEYYSNLYGGADALRTLVLYNDTLSDATLDVRWRLMLAGLPVESGVQSVDLQAGGKTDLGISMAVGEVAERTQMELTVEIDRDGETVFSDTHELSAHPRYEVTAPAGRSVVIYDPRGSLDGLVSDTVARIDDLNALPDPPAVLLIGADAFDAREDAVPIIGPTTETQGALGAFVGAGGRAVVLRQGALPAELGDSLTDHASTMTFRQMQDHPILAALEDRDLKWWAYAGAERDHRVSADEPARPSAGASRAVVTSAGRSGIAYAPILEQPRGEGVVILCQMLITEKADVEPVALILLQNMLNYAATYEGAASTAALVSGDEATTLALERVGLDFDDLRAEGPASAEDYDLIIAAPPIADPAALRRLAEAGATVIMHNPDVDLSPALVSGEGAGYRIDKATGPVMRTGDDWLTQHIAHEDLYWLGKHTGSPFSATPLTSDIITQALTVDTSNVEPIVYPWQDMELSGSITGKVEGQDAFGFFTTGEGRIPVDFGAGGSFLIGARLGGTPAAGTWSQCRIAVDGATVGLLSTTEGGIRDYATLADVDAGVHEVVLSFINDGSGPGEDRNLFLQSLLVAPYDAPEGGLHLLLRPGALAESPVGEGRIVVDCVRWDAPGSNGTRAMRYLSGLLTGLDAPFRSESMSRVEAETLTIEPGVPFSQVQGDELAFGCNGSASGPIEVTEAGRYALDLIGRGTPAAGVYPIVRVLIDGEMLAEVEVASDGLAPHALGVHELTAGRHTLTLQFINDFSAPPEDRNVALDRLVARRAE